jgi:hypothetical protein
MAPECQHKAHMGGPMDMLINIYLGPLDFITSNIGKNFISKEFKEYMNTMGIHTKVVLVEAHNSIGMVE